MAPWGIWLLVLGGLILLFLIPCLFAHRKKTKKILISKKSPLILELQRLNRDTYYKNENKNEFNFIYYFRTRRSAVNFDPSKGFEQYAAANRSSIEENILEYEVNFAKYQKYRDQVSEIQNSYRPSLELIKSMGLSKRTYIRWEQEIAEQLIFSDHFCPPTVVIGVFYSSPQGRSIYERQWTFSENDIASFFHLNLEENRLLDAKSCEKSFVVDHCFLYSGERGSPEKLESNNGSFQGTIRAGSSFGSGISTVPAKMSQTKKAEALETASVCAENEKIDLTGPEPPRVVPSQAIPNDIKNLEQGLKDGIQKNASSELTTPEVFSQSDDTPEEVVSFPQKIAETNKKKSRVVVAKGSDGVFASCNGEEVRFFPKDTIEPVPIEELSYFRKQGLDEVLLKECLKAFTEAESIPLSFETLYSHIQSTFGIKTIPEDYFRALLQPGNPLLLRTHIFYVWPNPLTCPAEGVKARVDFSFDTEEKVCRFYHLIKENELQCYPIIAFFLRFFLSYSINVKIEDTSTVFTIPLQSLANYFLLMTSDEVKYSPLGFRALFGIFGQTNVDPQKIIDHESHGFFAEPYFNQVLDSVRVMVTKQIDLSNRFYVLAGDTGILVDGAFLCELNRESGMLSKALTDNVNIYQRASNYPETSRIFDSGFLGNLSLPKYAFDFSDLVDGELERDFGPLLDSPFLFLENTYFAFSKFGITDEENVFSILAKNGFKVSKYDGIAYKKKYLNLADAIFRGDIQAKQKTEFIYDNPDKLKTYDAAVKSLLSDLLIFYDRPGVYKTRVYLEQLGLTSGDLDVFQESLKKFIVRNSVFSFPQIRAQYAGTAVGSFIQDDTYLTLFVQSVCHPSRYSLEREGGNYIYYTLSFDAMLKKIFRKVLIGSTSCTIYEIRDDIQTDFGLTYNLDQIGKDATKVGFYYSDDFEKVYKKKADYLMEVYSHK